CFFNHTASPHLYSLSLHDALPIYDSHRYSEHHALQPAIVEKVIDHLVVRFNGISALQCSNRSSEVPTLYKQMAEETEHDPYDQRRDGGHLEEHDAENHNNRR